MSIKTVLCLLSGQAYDLGALDRALSLVHELRGVLNVVHLTPMPPMADAAGIGIYAAVPFGDNHTFELLEQENATQTAVSEASMRDHAKAMGVPVLPHGQAVTMNQAQAFFHIRENNPSDFFYQGGFPADLTVASLDNRPEGNLGVVLSALFQGGQPVLAIPRRSDAGEDSKGYPDRVVFAWDGSRSCLHALREATPFMLHAEEVFVIQVITPGVAEIPGFKLNLLAYLRSHCIDAAFIYAEADKRKTGEVLLEEATRLKGAMLILGAYGHGHVAEMLLGGTTDYVLKHTGRPVLLVH